ncbi:MAG: translation elongation factor 4 [Patescibacteria group bacterium]|nr:translation elongation factor 4 [Patescibacteria group bacterium]
MDKIRNFCIIAHIDHGKSTLADRLLEITGTVAKRDMKAQLLDTMELEREKGITIKLQPARMKWKDHELNLIDTPGHVDFSYEVSRSLEAVEGAILVVDASQGIQAQTLANVYMAIEAGLHIIPVMNKIDLPAAEPDRVAQEIGNLLGVDPLSVGKISAKTGEGVDDLLDRIIRDVPEPKYEEGPTRALIFDSIYDGYRGVILYVRVVSGTISTNSEITLMQSKSDSLALEVGHLSPARVEDSEIGPGQIGFITTNIKSVQFARVGDTVTLTEDQATSPLPGYKKVQPLIFASFYTISQEDYPKLKDSLEKLSLNDASLSYTSENSAALGFGVRIGFLGLLHLEIIKERLEREFDIELIVTSPSVSYEVMLTNGSTNKIEQASDLPDEALILSIAEPWVRGEIVTPSEFIGPVLSLIIEARGRQTKLEYFDQSRAVIGFEAPLAEIITDFYDALKSQSSGFASLTYEWDRYEVGDLVKVDILLGGEKVDSLGAIIARSKSEVYGRDLCARLKQLIPRQNFEIAVQAAIGAKFIARENISAVRKDVTAKLYGGDISRKKKLLQKQKKGKARMKQIGKVSVPSSVFMDLIKKA